MFRFNLSIARDRPGQPVTLNFRDELPGSDELDEVNSVGPVEVEATVIYVDGLYWLDGTVHGRAELNCARCLESFEFPFQLKIAERYRQDAVADETEATVVAGEQVDLTGKVLESIVLALPMKALCHPECRGLCPECGRMLKDAACDCHVNQIDPRFAGLEKLLKSESKGVE